MKKTLRFTCDIEVELADVYVSEKDEPQGYVEAQNELIQALKKTPELLYAYFRRNAENALLQLGERIDRSREEDDAATLAALTPYLSNDVIEVLKAALSEQVFAENTEGALYEAWASRIRATLIDLDGQGEAWEYRSDLEDLFGDVQASPVPATSDGTLDA